MRQRTVPYLEPLLGGVWWTVGSLALDAGAGTAVLAVGLGVTGALVMTLRRDPALPLRAGDRGRLLRLLVITAALVAVAGTVLGMVGLGELAVPVACAMVGMALVPVSSLLDQRSVLAAGAALMVLGAVGALLALGSAGRLYPQGVVGLLAGALLWVAGAHRSGLIARSIDR